jgi:hypothetical protein
VPKQHPASANFEARASQGAGCWLPMSDRVPHTGMTEPGVERPTVTELSGDATTASDWSRTQAFTFASGALVLALNVVTGVLIARALGTSGRGEVTAIMALPQTVAWVCAMGCFQAVSYHQAKHPEDGGRLISSWLVLLAPFAALGVLAGYALLPALLPHRPTRQRSSRRYIS